MVSRIEGEFSAQPEKPISVPLEGELSGRKFEDVRKSGIYCVAIPVGLGAKVLSLAGSTADQLTFRPVVWGLSTVGWLGGKALYYAGRVTEIFGRVLQKDLSRRVGAQASLYTEEYFSKALGVRTAIGEAAAHTVAYIPLAGGPLATLEKGERAAERALSVGGTSIVTKIWKCGTSLLPFTGQVLESGGRAAAVAARKIADITYIGMTEPSRLNHVFQDFRDRMDSYAFTLLSAQEPPRPVVPLCTEGDFRHFMKLGKAARKKIFQAVTASPWLRMSDDEKRTFAEALKKKGVKRTDEDRNSLRVMYSAYLCLTQLRAEREKLAAPEAVFQEFINASSEEQGKKLFIVLSSPMWDVPRGDREKFEAALSAVLEAQAHHEPLPEPSVRLVREFLGMYATLPEDYVNRALTPLDFDQKVHALDPVMARIRIMDIVRENAPDLDPNERRTLAKYRSLRQIDDWLALDEAAQQTLEKIIFFHFNRLSIKDQAKLYDVTPQHIWDLPDELRREFFFEGQRLLREANVSDFERMDVQNFIHNYTVVEQFAEVLNNSLRLGKKIVLHQMVTPPPTVIAFTKDQLKAEILKVKARLESSEPLAEQEKRQLSLYRAMLESTLRTREAFVPLHELEPAVSREEVFAQKARLPVDVARIQMNVGSDVVTSGAIYTPCRYLGRAEQWAGTGVGVVLEKLAQAVGFASTPALIQLMFGAVSFGLSLFATEENVILAIKTLGIEEKVRTMESGAAQVFPLLLRLSGPLERLVLSGVTSAKEWMTVMARAMRMLGDPATSAQQIEEIVAELRLARDGVCEAAASLSGSGVELGKEVQVATDMILQQCAMGGASGLLRQAEEAFPSVSPAVAQAATTIRQALVARNIGEPEKGILGALKRLWYWGASFGQRPTADSLAEVHELAQRLTLLQQAGHASERVQGLQRMLELFPPVHSFVSSPAAQKAATGYVAVIEPLLEGVRTGLVAEQGLLSLGSEALLAHLKWVDLAREGGRYSTEAAEAMARQAEELAGQGGWKQYVGTSLSYTSKVASYALPVAYSLTLGTGGFVLTPILLAFVANDLLPSAGAYLAPRARPMWRYLGYLSKRASEAVGKVVGEATQGIGYYLQRAWNSGRYVDEQRIENFLHVLDEKDRDFIFQAVQASSTISVEDRAELEKLWARYKGKELPSSEEKMLITRLLLGFEELKADDLLRISPRYFSMLSPAVQERLVAIVERYHPLTVDEKRARNYVEMVVERYMALTSSRRAEIDIIPPWEYHRLTEEQQRELRFLIVHSSAYQQNMKKKIAEESGTEEEVVLDPGAVLKEFEREPKGRELRSFLAIYQQLGPQDIAGITPQQLLTAGEAKILHALSILETYHAPWIRLVADQKGTDVSLLRQIISTVPPRSVAMEIQKKRLVEALASLCRQMPDYQQQYLLDMTEEEAVEMAEDAEKLQKCLSHLATHTIDEEAKRSLSSLLGAYAEGKGNPTSLAAAFNALSDTQKAEFRQGLQPRADAIELARQSLAATNVELMELVEVVEKNKFSLESLIATAELIRSRARERLSHQDEMKIQRYERNATAFAAKIEVIEKRIGELLAVRSKLVETLERVGVRDIPPLPLEEVEKHNPQRKSEAFLISEIVNFDIEANEERVRQQVTVQELEDTQQSLLEQHAFRLYKVKEAIVAMERANLDFRRRSVEGPPIERTKAKASSIFLEKRIRFLQLYLRTDEEQFKRVEKAIEKRRVEVQEQKGKVED